MDGKCGSVVTVKDNKRKVKVLCTIFKLDRRTAAPILYSFSVS
jgi:hypothetical protein